MSTASDKYGSDHSELPYLYSLRALPSPEMSAAEAHISGCAECQGEVTRLRPIVESLVAWPTDVLRPAQSLWPRLAERLEAEGVAPIDPVKQSWAEPAWENVAPGLACKLLATDKDRVSMLVRLAPGAAYPPHTHAEVEELHLLQGELWIDGRKLYAGDYNRAEAGTGDEQVWSETGCTCVLIASPRDLLQS